MGSYPHVLAEMECNFWVIRQTPHSSSTEPLEIQTDLHHSPKESPTLRSHRPKLIGRSISWCTNGLKSYVGGSPHVLAEMERNLWVMPIKKIRI